MESVDAAGNVVVAWLDSNTGLLNSARFSPQTNSWTFLTSLDLGLNDNYLLFFSGNPQGDVVAVWIQVNGETTVVQSAALEAEASRWIHLSDVGSFPGTVDTYAYVSLSQSGDAVVVWEDASSFRKIFSSIFLDLFELEPPSFFTGKVKEVKFLSQTDRVNKLQWGKSPDPFVVFYRLYRDSVLIATVSNDRKTFVYEDHNRRKGVTYTYKLVAVDTADNESDPLYVVLP